jgi:hypothetical protein
MKTFYWRLGLAVLLFALNLWVGPPEPGLIGGFIGTALAIGLAAASVAGGVGSAIIGSHAANNAASTQANAANYAADKQYEASLKALKLQQDQFDYSKSIQAPFIQTGTNALQNLGYLLGINPQGTGAGTNAGTGTGTGVNPAPVTSGVNGSTLDFGGKGSDPDQIPIMTDHNIAATGDVPDGNGGYNVVTNPPTDNGTATATGTTGTAPTNTNAINPNLGDYGSLLKGFDEKFVAPTEVNMQNDPGYLTRLAAGEKAIQSSAAAKGTCSRAGPGSSSRAMRRTTARTSTTTSITARSTSMPSVTTSSTTTRPTNITGWRTRRG